MKLMLLVVLVAALSLACSFEPCEKFRVSQRYLEVEEKFPITLNGNILPETGYLSCAKPEETYTIRVSLPPDVKVVSLICQHGKACSSQEYRGEVATSFSVVEDTRIVLVIIPKDMEWGSQLIP